MSDEDSTPEEWLSITAGNGKGQTMRNYYKETAATPALLNQLRAAARGLSGDQDAEAVLGWTKHDSAQGYVDFYSCRGSDILRVIDRCGSQIISFTKRDESISLRIRIRSEGGQKVFRGMEFAFAPVDVESAPLPEGAFAK